MLQGKRYALSGLPSTAVLLYAPRGCWTRHAPAFQHRSPDVHEVWLCRTRILCGGDYSRGRPAVQKFPLRKPTPLLRGLLCASGKPFGKVMEVTRFELVTPCLPDRCSTGLSYTPIKIGGRYRPRSGRLDDANVALYQ